jgi:hypothetical protein
MQQLFWEGRPLASPLPEEGPIVGRVSVDEPNGRLTLHLHAGDAAALVDALVLAWPDRAERPLRIHRLVRLFGHGEEGAYRPSYRGVVIGDAADLG